MTPIPKLTDIIPRSGRFQDVVYLSTAAMAGLGISTLSLSPQSTHLMQACSQENLHACVARGRQVF